MADLNTNVTVNMGGNLSRTARRFGRAIDRFSTRSARRLQSLQRVTHRTGKAFDRFGNRVTALAGGAAAAATMRDLITLERRFTRLGIQAKVSDEQIKGVRTRIFEVASMNTINVDPGQITAAIEAIVEKTGDLKFAMENIDTLARTIGGTGADGGSVGALIAEFQKFNVISMDQVTEALNIFVAQGKDGAFTLANLSKEGERLMSAYAATGRGGIVAIRELGAVIQVIRKGTGSTEQAATAFEAFLGTLQDAKKLKILQGAGLQIFEKDQPGVMRSIVDIMQELIDKVGGDGVKLSGVFDREAGRALLAAIVEYKKLGIVKSLNDFRDIQITGEEIHIDAARAARDLAGALQSLQTQFRMFATDNLAEPIKDFAKAINDLRPEQLRQAMEYLKMGGLAIGGFIVAKKLGVFKALGAVGKFAARRMASGGGLAGAVGKALVAQPVIVTNWPANFGGGGGGGGGGRGARGGRGRGGRSALGRYASTAGRAASSTGSSLLQRFAPWLKTAGRVAARGAVPAAGAVMGVVQIGGALMDDSLSAQEKAQGVGGGVGATTGAVVGGLIGAFGGPLGIAIGATIGTVAGEALGEAVARYFTDNEVKNGGAGVSGEPMDVRLQVEMVGGDVRVRNAEVNRGSISVEVTEADSGLVMGAGL